FNPDGSPRFSLPALFGAGGVRTATGDVNGDGVGDLIVADGPGAAPAVRVFDGATRGEIGSLMAFEETFTGGVFVAAADFDGDGADDIVASPDQGGGPRVRILSGATLTTLADFFGIEDLAFRGGARAAA